MISNKFMKNKNVEELNFELLNLFKEYFNLRIQLSSGKLKKTHLIRSCRRNIARVKTFLTIKELNCVKKKKN